MAKSKLRDRLFDWLLGGDKAGEPYRAYTIVLNIGDTTLAKGLTVSYPDDLRVGFDLLDKRSFVSIRGELLDNIKSNMWGSVRVYEIEFKRN